ncbi:MAG: hypothetical protein LBV67_06045 [Streptococcaceae bacterium]|jgi:hypothetical protein|nr:hypothetical protein [Streptococcaceae bacterium]
MESTSIKDCIQNINGHHFINATDSRVYFVDDSYKGKGIKPGYILKMTAYTKLNAPIELKSRMAINCIEYIEKEPTPTLAGLAMLDEIERLAEEMQVKLIVIASPSAAQAYPGRVVSLVIADGYEHVWQNPTKHSINRFYIANASE